jgi:hypothetical protein
VVFDGVDGQEIDGPANPAFEIFKEAEVATMHIGIVLTEIDEEIEIARLGIPGASGG